MLLSCSVGITPKLLGSGLLLVFIAALGVRVVYVNVDQVI